jgi:hypothetical protein
MAGAARMNAAASSATPPRPKPEEKGEAVDTPFGVEPSFGLVGTSSEPAPARCEAAALGVDAEAGEGWAAVCEPLLGASAAAAAPLFVPVALGLLGSFRPLRLAGPPSPSRRGAVAAGGAAWWSSPVEADGAGAL